MANRNTSAAYDYSKFETHSTAAAPQRRPQPKQPPKPRLLPDAPKSPQQRRAEAIAHFKQVVRTFALSSFMLALVAAVIYGRVELTDLGSERAKLEARLAVAQSEHTRLETQLGSVISLDKVEEYAQTRLGMVKRERYQITYLDLTDGDAVMLYNGE